MSPESTSRRPTRKKKVEDKSPVLEIAVAAVVGCIVGAAFVIFTETRQPVEVEE